MSGQAGTFSSLTLQRAGTPMVELFQRSARVVLIVLSNGALALTSYGG